MATILCLETATTNCSVTLSIDGSVIAFREDDSAGYSHAEKLHVFIADVLKEASVTMENLDAIAVSKGPGSYTGLRIGVSAAKGLCYALDIPLISIPTLTLLAEKVSEKGIIIPMIDARRMEVYSAVFSSERKQIRETKAEILTETSFKEYASEAKIICIGNGVTKFKEICQWTTVVFMENIQPSSKEMALIAENKYKKNDTEDVAYFEPYYLKDFKVG
ncbi:tRNA (adenosine(37)-N6)-threonylcarbamoyltransferase complex dimerization subunit type 1 TsaB [Jejudonia soesokkakensis]|uniref:tRNA (Adenosine(37)-N6)-threonylcarbamoyltransferase complex dimerization subunit type 1 TsaB n=1 Tax=Jejudonia soesokkakensis TaxID=1323432 RepID=A0ABW2MWS5_9FLAO